MAFGGGLEDNDEVMSEINMTPLVDVMLVLLVIFIITVPVLTHAVKVDLPQAENQRNVVEPETVTLSLSRDGELHWNRDVITTSILEARLQQAALQQPRPEVHILADQAVAYGRVAQLMAAIQRAGIEKLGFVTDPGS